MKNYIDEARKSGITLFSLPNNEYIQKYVINRENEYVQITYMNGRRETKPLEETTEEELEKLQEEHFSEISRKISLKINEVSRWKKGLIVIWGVNAFTNFIASNFFSGILHLGCSACWYMQIHRPLKLQKELQLTSWIYEHKESVDKLIEEETKSMIKTQNIDYSALPYPKEIVEEGRNLNNMELLDVKQLKKIKKAVKKMPGESLEISH